MGEGIKSDSSAKVVKIADHESKHTLSLLAQAKRNIGKYKGLDKKQA